MKKKIIGVIIFSFLMISCGTSTSPSSSKDAGSNPPPPSSDSLKQDPVDADPCVSITVQSGVSDWCGCHAASLNSGFVHQFLVNQPIIKKKS